MAESDVRLPCQRLVILAQQADTVQIRI